MATWSQKPRSKVKTKPHRHFHRRKEGHWVSEAVLAYQKKTAVRLYEGLR